MKRLLPLVLPLALAACSAPPQGEQPAQATTPPMVSTATAIDAKTLAANHWKLAEAHDAQGRALDALLVRADAPVQLDFADGRVSVSNTCNRMGGGYAVEGNQLKFGRFASTMMACVDPNLAALDQEVGKRFEGALTAETPDAATLKLTTATGDVLVFKGEPTAEMRYGGPGEKAFLEVAAETKPCSHPLIPDKQCLQVRELQYDDKGLKVGAPGEFQNFYADIEGYKHEPGVRNVLRVKRFKIANPPADAPNQAYVLDMVVESETVKK
ncbi:META and DUF4377 domain-containing protein [Pseudoxanthomonas helianthi]|uniref:META and DUF4377 domain-containing protein n=1 Tax=Pseudoxanthomonas helianthi TaxID=1453541 RepID=A0A941AVI6_9GAMM|nr:META and DUF4377 domain-containing protein [Pseudoxanthomonas helianthi]MBP3984033.1 META and DUF4377 domain-containing protein [Pseudoxanthomonas helianthi]